jgi:hypothetical protein
MIWVSLVGVALPKSGEDRDEGGLTGKAVALLKQFG